MHMTHRIHLVVDDREHAAFAAHATAQGSSLSEWLRQAARERLEREQPARISSVDDLERFFAECDLMAADARSAEPDWEQHLVVMESSRQAGLEPG